MRIAIAGAGISGLATAYVLQTLQPGFEIEIFEASGRSGGKAWTDVSPQGYHCEWGVNGFLDNKPQTLELCSQLALQPLRASESARRRYVYRRGRMHLLPGSPPEFLTSRLLSLRGRMRVMAEFLVPRGGSADETLQEFAVRRLGREGFEALIDPMASGVFAGDPSKMSLVSCFPRIHELEEQYGSLIAALIRLQIRARRQGQSELPGAGPGGALTSFSGGISEMIQGLEMALNARIRKNAPVTGISREGSRFQLQIHGHDSEEFDAVILAVPAGVQSTLLADLSPHASSALGEIEYPPLAVVCLGYRLEDISASADGFGFLVPFTEQRRILGAVIDSNVFAGRAPAGRSLLRVMIGGSRAPHLAMNKDDRLSDLARMELEIMTGIRAEPEFQRIYRHEKAIPQYHAGHAGKIDFIERHLEGVPGLYLAGNALRGVSLNDCVSNAFRLAALVSANGAAES